MNLATDDLFVILGWFQGYFERGGWVVWGGGILSLCFFCVKVSNIIEDDAT